MKTTDLFELLKSEVELITLTYNLEVDIEDCDDMNHLVYQGLLSDNYLDDDIKISLITYSHLLQIKKSNPNSELSFTLKYT